MANVKTALNRVEFIIEEEQTHCNVFMVSDEPSNPFWGNGWRTKTFPASKSAVDILNKDLVDHLDWNKGRSGVE